MLNSYNLRRIAEVKLLEFVVSLRFYVKSNTRALTFAKLLGVIPISTNINEGSSLESQLAFKLDENMMNYYLHCFQVLRDLMANETVEKDGNIC